MSQPISAIAHSWSSVGSNGRAARRRSKHGPPGMWAQKAYPTRALSARASGTARASGPLRRPAFFGPGEALHSTGETDGSCRIRSRHKPVAAAKLQGQRIVFAGGCRKGIQNQTANLARRKLLGSSVHGNDAPEINRVALVETVQKRHGHALEAVIELHDACDAYSHAGRKSLRKPRLAKERRDKRGGSVHKSHFDKVELRLGMLRA